MKFLVAAPLFLLILIVDLITKAVAVSVLAPSGTVVPVVGDWFRFSLVYNPGAAFGLHLGAHSRWLFLGLTSVALVVLWQMLRRADDSDIRRVLAISLVSAGALGNALDRIRSERGVVDFIDIGFGMHRWPTFNVADIAVSTGAILLAMVLWREDSELASGVTEESEGGRPLSFRGSEKPPAAN